MAALTPPKGDDGSRKPHGRYAWEGRGRGGGTGGKECRSVLPFLAPEPSGGSFWWPDGLSRNVGRALVVGQCVRTC